MLTYAHRHTEAATTHGILSENNVKANITANLKQKIEREIHIKKGRSDRERIWLELRLPSEPIHKEEGYRTVQMS